MVPGAGSLAISDGATARNARTNSGSAANRSGRFSVAAALAQLLMSAGLVACISVLAISLSVGFARAQSQQAIGEPDTGLVIALLIVAITVMGVLSAAAVRFAGRPRPSRTRRA